MASAVEFEPEPAITGTRPSDWSMHHSTTCLCSSCDRVGLSPVVPTGTRPLVPSEICQSTMSRNAFSSTEPFLNGVTSAVKEPRKLVLAVMARLLHRDATLCTHRYRVAGMDESPERKWVDELAL